MHNVFKGLEALLVGFYIHTIIQCINHFMTFYVHHDVDEIA